MTIIDYDLMLRVKDPENYNFAVIFFWEYVIDLVILLSTIKWYMGFNNLQGVNDLRLCSPFQNQRLIKKTYIEWNSLIATKLWEFEHCKGF